MPKSNLFRKLELLLIAVLLAALLIACSSNNGIANKPGQGVVALPSIEVDHNGGVIVSSDNVSTPVKVSSEQPTVTPVSIPTPKPSPTHPVIVTPTLSGTPEPIDKNYELGLLKKAYDNINQHLFKEPDNSAILTVTLKELRSITGIEINIPAFSGTPEQSWNKFSETYNNALDVLIAKGWQYPKGDLAHRLIIEMAYAVGDEHTYFMNKTATQNRQNLFAGDNSQIGFGIVPVFYNDKVYISRVIPTAPAGKIGLRAGDQIAAYDDVMLSTKNWQIVRDAKENENHKFTIQRIGESNLLFINVVKARYNMPTVEYRMVNANIGYIAIRDFFKNVADETDQAMRDLYAKGAVAWIIDVRGNPGGINFDQLAGRFLENGQVIGYDYDRTNRSEVRVSNGGTTGNNKGKAFSPLLPIAVLIDDGSASASEIFALTMRDYKLGSLIGTRSAGALGYTQEFQLGDGTSISVTIREYESKGGEKLNGLGIEPEIKVDLTVEDLAMGRDPQLGAGVSYLQKSLANKDS